uniref:CC domain-containing protein n=1 Tax=Heterorhabditis bacteriophora TaxID=37862 RepID=A0A1I7XTG6_HETBA
MARTAKLLAILFPFLVFQVDCQTPVIGGSCKLGTADVQIGGKQTQFFLKCEATSDSGSGEGVWVVKSRMAVTQPSTSVAVPSENTQAQQHPKIIPKQNSPNICEQDVNAREADSCAVSATCLQASQDTPSSYLQCDQTFLTPISQSSAICSDGSSSLSQCPPTCPAGSFCNSHGFCCPHSSQLSCNFPCSLSNLCPSGMSCSLSSHCCEFGKLHRDLNSRDLNEKVFMGDNNVFDSFDVNAVRLYNMTAISSTSVPYVSTTGTWWSPTTRATTVSSSLAAVACHGTNAVCSSNDDCPPTFICESDCCRLKICPSGSNVIYTCTTGYQCGSDETCIFGACCATSKKKHNSGVISHFTNELYNAELKATNTAYIYGNDNIGNDTEQEYQSKEITTSPATMLTVNMMSMTSSIPLVVTPEVCHIDSRVENCSLENPCPNTSECMAGQCCKLLSSTCKNGLMALTIPDSCVMSDDCPIASLCENGRCCPLDMNPSTNDNDDSMQLFSEVLSTESIPTLETTPIKGISASSEDTKAKFGRCLASIRCSSLRMCPPKFTCSLEGKCCHYKQLCSDGTVPESMCDSKTLCPSSAHMCISMDRDLHVCCPIRDQTYNSCPNNSVEVLPRFGTTCRYSLQCPAPYFCNRRGKCCQPTL